MKFRCFVSALSLALSSPAQAEEPTAAEATQVPLEKDFITGHFQVGATAGYILPFGQLSQVFHYRERAGNGGGFGLDTSYGIDRFISVGAYGQYELGGGSGACTGCSSRGWGTGLMVRYHIVQGLRLDPWVSYGVGFRSLRATDESSTFSYSSIEWLRLQIGANWYATSTLLISPFVQYSAATTVSSPKGESLGSTDSRFQFGLRFAIDLPGR